VHGLTATVRTFAADDFKHIAYLVRARIVIKTKRDGECVHAQASGDQEGQRLGDQLSPILEKEFRQAGMVVNEIKKRG